MRLLHMLPHIKGQKMKDITLIRQTVLTLNTIEVKGKDNMSKLLGCIYALEGVIKDSEQTTKEDGEVDAE